MSNNKKVTFSDAVIDKKKDTIVVDHFKEEQERKDQRGIFKLKREIWVQDRKDRRAQMEIVSQAESDINKIYEVMATTLKGKGWWNIDKPKSVFDKRLKDTETRIKNAEAQIKYLTKKINNAEDELVTYSYEM